MNSGGRNVTGFTGKFSILPPFLQNSKFKDNKPCDSLQMKAILAMVKDQPSLFMANDNFQDSVLIEPFEIVIGGDPSNDEVMTLRPEITKIISKYWMPWLRDMDFQTTAFGFAPFYFRYAEVQVPVDEADQDYDDDSDEDETQYYGDPYIDALRFEQKRRERDLRREREREEKEKEDAMDIDEKPTEPKSFANIKRRSKKRMMKNLLLYWPVTPSPEMGSVETFIHDKDQHLIWKWADRMGKKPNGENDYDTKMYFIVEKMPSLDTGQVNSRLACLVSHWQTLVNLRTLNTEIVNRIAKKESVVEYNPSLTSGISTADRPYIEGAHPSAHFPNITVGQKNQQNGVYTNPLLSALNAVSNFRGGQMNSDAAKGNSDQGFKNAGLDPMGQIINTTETRGVNPQVEAMESLNLFLANNPEAASHLRFVKNKLPGAHYLDPYEHYIPMTQPSSDLTDKVMQLEADFNRLASSVLSSPIELSTGPTSKVGAASGIESQQSFLHQRIRFRIKFFCTAVKQVFTLAFLNMFEQTKNDLDRLKQFHFLENRPIQDILELERQLDIQVIFKPSVGNMEDEQIIEYYRHGAIDEDEAYNMFFQKIGYTDPPMKATPIFKKRMEELYRKSPEEEAEIAANAKISSKENSQGGKDKPKKRKAEGSASKDKPTKKPKKDK